MFRHAGPCIYKVCDEFGSVCSNQFFISANSKRRQTNWQPNSQNCKIVIMESATSFVWILSWALVSLLRLICVGTQAGRRTGNQLKFISSWKIKLFHITFNFNSSKCNFIPNIHQFSIQSVIARRSSTYHIAPLFRHRQKHIDMVVNGGYTWL